MPTYDYECKACGKTFEIFHPMSEAPRRKCPGCGKAKLERLIGGGGGFLFKGSGFYITDYRSDGYKAQAKAESGGGSKNGTGESGGGEKADRKAGEKAGEKPAAKSAEKNEKSEKKEPAKPAETKKADSSPSRE